MPKKPPKKKRRVRLDQDDAEFARAMASLDESGIWPVLSEKVLAEKEAPEPEVGSGRRRSARKSRSGRARAESAEIERLDLHGYSIAEALDQLERFLVHSAARDLRRVLVITGHGRRSPGGVSILRSKVGAWLRREAMPWVRAVEAAPAHLGGDGAWLVRLWRQRPR